MQSGISIALIPCVSSSGKGKPITGIGSDEWLLGDWESWGRPARLGKQRVEGLRGDTKQLVCDGFVELHMGIVKSST